MNRYIKLITYAFIFILFLNGISFADNYYLIKKSKVMLPPLVPYSVKGLNGYLVKDETGKPIYLIALYAKVKGYSWYIDTIYFKNNRNLSEDYKDKIIQDNPEYLYLNEKIQLKIIVKSLSNNKSNLKLSIPYFIISKLYEKSNLRKEKQYIPFLFAGVKAIRTGQSFNNKVNDVNISSSSVMNNRDFNYSLAELTSGNMKIDLLNNKSYTKVVYLSIKYRADTYNNLELLTGFKLNQDQYNTLQSFGNDQKNHG